ncbi:unnamed protein product, partial [marine sediment metagenome]
MGTAIRRPAEAAEESGAIMKANPVFPEAHQAKTNETSAIMGITHFLEIASSLSPEIPGLMTLLCTSRAHIEERVSSMESIVEI